MAETTFNQPNMVQQAVQNLDLDKWFTRFFGIGAALAGIRMLWVIFQTSGVFGAPPDAWIGDFEELFGIGLWLYILAGLVVLVAGVYYRLQAIENDPISNLITNWAGALLMVGLAERVSFVLITGGGDLPFERWLTLLQQGLVQGGVYALIALGYTLVYGILFMINFAHGEVLMFGTYFGWFTLLFITNQGAESFESGATDLANWAVPVVVGFLFLPLEDLYSRFTTEQSPGADPRNVFIWISSPVRYALGFLIGMGAIYGVGVAAPQVHLVVITIVGVLAVIIVAMIASTIVAVILERVAYRPLRKAPRLTPLISAIGASIFLQEVARLAFIQNQDYNPKPAFLDPTNSNARIRIDLGGQLGEFAIPYISIAIVIASIGMMALLYFIVIRTKFGKAMRAVAEDKETASLMGIDVDRVIVLTFVLGAALAGAAGAMIGFRGISLTSKFGFKFGLKAFTAAVLGGIGNIPGAMLGGFFLGIVESLGWQMLGLNNGWRDAISFTLLVLVIIFRPTGILGEAASEKKV